MRAIFKPLLVIVDAGLLLYWSMVIADMFPEELRFRDYSNEVVQAWNWSFFPLDITAALFVFLGAYLTKRKVGAGDLVLMFGLTLTFCAGFMAISFWAYYGDFEVFWWGANGRFQRMGNAKSVTEVTEGGYLSDGTLHRGFEG